MMNVSTILLFGALVLLGVMFSRTRLLRWLSRVVLLVGLVLSSYRLISPWTAYPGKDFGDFLTSDPGVLVNAAFVLIFALLFIFNLLGIGGKKSKKKSPVGCLISLLILVALLLFLSKFLFPGLLG